MEHVGKVREYPEKIIEVNDEEMRLCWRGYPDYIPSILLLTEKVQRVTALPDGQCPYEVYITMSRPAAYIIKWLSGEQLSAYVKGMAKGMKEYVEGQDSGRH